MFCMWKRLDGSLLPRVRNVTERDALLFLSGYRSQSRCTVSKVQRRFHCYVLLDLLSKAIPRVSALGLRHSLPVFLHPNIP